MESAPLVIKPYQRFAVDVCICYGSGTQTVAMVT